MREVVDIRDEIATQLEKPCGRAQARCTFASRHAKDHWRVEQYGACTYHVADRRGRILGIDSERLRQRSMPAAIAWRLPAVAVVSCWRRKQWHPGAAVASCWRRKQWHPCTTSRKWRKRLKGDNAAEHRLQRVSWLHHGPHFALPEIEIARDLTNANGPPVPPTDTSLANASSPLRSAAGTSTSLGCPLLHLEFQSQATSSCCYGPAAHRGSTRVCGALQLWRCRTV